MTGTIRVCADPTGAHWQLGELPARSGRLILIGWHHAIDSAEAIVPPPLVRALASAMTNIARVTFLSSERCAEQQRSARAEWSHVDGDDVRRIPPDGLGDWARAKLAGAPTTIVQVSTVRAHVAERFFDDSRYPLWLQMQLALLSAPDSSPPTLDRTALLALMGENWTSPTPSLTAEGVLGILRPGVDGDMLGFLSLDAAFGTAFVHALEAGARSVGFDWTNVDEADF